MCSVGSVCMTVFLFFDLLPLLHVMFGESVPPTPVVYSKRRSFLSSSNSDRTSAYASANAKAKTKANTPDRSELAFFDSVFCLFFVFLFSILFLSVCVSNAPQYVNR